MHAAQTGVVFGNGSSIDRLSDSFFRLIEQPGYLSCGVNRIGISKRLADAGYVPDLSLVWDPPHKFVQDGDCKYEIVDFGGCRIKTPADVKAFRWQSNEDIKTSLAALKGRTWRVCLSRGPNFDLWDADQWVLPDGKLTGDIATEGIRSLGSVTDAAVNLLYRMGVREVYLYGVDLGGPYFEFTGPPRLPVEWWGPETALAMAACWTKIQGELRDLTVWCANPDSLLVREGLIRFRALPEKIDRQDAPGSTIGTRRDPQHV